MTNQITVWKMLDLENDGPSQKAKSKGYRKCDLVRHIPGLAFYSRPIIRRYTGI